MIGPAKKKSVDLLAIRCRSSWLMYGFWGQPGKQEVGKAGGWVGGWEKNKGGQADGWVGGQAGKQAKKEQGGSTRDGGRTREIRERERGVRGNGRHLFGVFEGCGRHYDVVPLQVARQVVLVVPQADVGRGKPGVACTTPQLHGCVSVWGGGTAQHGMTQRRKTCEGVGVGACGRKCEKKCVRFWECVPVRERECVRRVGMRKKMGNV